MSVHLQRQIEKLEQQIKLLASRVEQQLLSAVTVIEKRDGALAEQVIAADNEIDELEVDIEEECLHALALHQPVAADLRYIVSVLKINNDLERIADMAANIAEQGRFLSQEPPLDPPPFDVAGMADRVRRMLSESLQAMLNVDPVRAERVRQGDDEIDAMHRHMYEQVEAAMRDHPDRIPTLIHYINISRQLERIADLATNIAEDVIYTAKGKLVRHKHS
jgi:phosphate transport system protein